ncbi:cell envelope biogenesis protein OmpA [Photobacterium phosphoreum]|uniref:Cell envelope biogenesis protein OmpA n=1 Tax=Photobacterium phosphoreum TaxID=659 RepID=A0A2T3JKW2_PHOPO|nr:OmpA family protein [Photobacterium phosphoreum]PSU24471.1 cell envelope biogenesis protein OmpA [Photobacterium phosphoreum]PSU44391.1 cell envelope biogenesis protein OmpA [Photobacterium phosphoreum]PSU49657.1 cell envelope biogenesis protein OmpA [Photobacterium phosphoreum]
MHQLFGKNDESGQDNGEHWLSISDLMAGLMMVFLFIAIVFMLKIEKESQKIKDVAVAYQDNQVAIYDALVNEFHDDLRLWGAEIDKETLSFNFTSPDVLFANNQSTLSNEYKTILNDFFPRYIEVLKPFRDSLDEVRIEGHTSSAGLRGSTKQQAYFYNMKLSQDRTRSVLEYGYSLMPTESDWITESIAAVGFSSSRLIKKNGVEDHKKSRRVSFRAITNADIQIKQILGAN